MEKEQELLIPPPPAFFLQQEDQKGNSLVHAQAAVLSVLSLGGVLLFYVRMVTVVVVSLDVQTGRHIQTTVTVVIFFVFS